VQAFYNEVTQSLWSTIDMAIRGTRMNKTKDEAYNLIKDMTLNNFLWSSERAQPKRLEVSWN